MVQLPQWARELRPNATWRGIELLWTVVGATVVASLLALIQYLKSHWDFVALFAVFLASFTALLCGAIRRRNPRVTSINDEPKLQAECRTISPSISHPLSIISARWGIGGDAYKDVTKIVREHAKPDSVNIPVSKGLFGDPYPNTLKRLTVVYSIARAREWEITVEESQTLRLPEKEGEEQSRKELERMQARLHALQGGAEDAILSSGISDAEYNLFMKLKGVFNSLRWCEKVALERICELGTVASRDLQIRLGADGFGDPAKIVGQLIYKGLVDETVAGMLRPKDARWIDALLKDNPVC